MTDLQTEFDQLFWACWWGEAPWTALADWLVETGHRGTARVTAGVNRYWNDRPFILKTELTVLTRAALPSCLTCYLETPQFGKHQHITLDRDVFCADFPTWIAEEVQRLRFDLHRRGYLLWST